MSKISSVMNIANRSMQNSQLGLQTVSHNIANKTTKGYSRQRVDFQTNAPIGHGKTRTGMGARGGSISRTNNPYLEKQLEKEGTKMGFANSRATSLARVEQVYNEQVNKGLNQFMGEFFNSFRELSTNPESLATRTLVKESADFLTKDFHRVNDQLNGIQSDMDFEIVTQIQEVNQITKEVASLNEKIQRVTMEGGPGNDERDRRELLLKELSSKMNISYAEDDTGLITVTAGKSAIIVSGYENRDLYANASPEEGKKLEGNFDVFYKPTDDGTPVRITEHITGGELGGVLEIRDKVVNDLIGELDQVAYDMSREVNKAHVKGFNQYSKTGGVFFESITEVKGAAKKLALNKSLKNDVGLIAAAGSINSPGDNRIANIISNIQNKKVMGGGDATIDDFYRSSVGRIGVLAGRANSEVESQGSIKKQLENMRESVSGVSLDEETTKMIEYQKSFDASARLIRTADEMMDTVLNLKR